MEWPFEVSSELSLEALFPFSRITCDLSRLPLYRTALHFPPYSALVLHVTHCRDCFMFFPCQ
ncbi:hypothetical protein J6590_072221 [Homalodisca vitripennis]|nr:hypothetical protein J6590_072221 [Homalodisca vitripennis]